MDSIEIFSSNLKDSGWILVSIKALFSSSNPTASLLHPEIALVTCYKNSIFIFIKNHTFDSELHIFIEMNQEMRQSYGIFFFFNLAR